MLKYWKYFLSNQNRILTTENNGNKQRGSQISSFFEDDLQNLIQGFSSAPKARSPPHPQPLGSYATNE